MSSNLEADWLQLIASLSASADEEVILGIGDDTAVIRGRPHERLLVSSDMLVEGTHFLRSATTLEAVGAKALAVNLSDMNAMGGRGRFFLVSLGCPKDANDADIRNLYNGLLSEAERAGAVLIGGDLVRAPQWVIDVTVLGYARPDAVCYRTGGRPGDILAVTGSLGAARAGLELLLAAEGEDPEAYWQARLSGNDQLYEDCLFCLEAQRRPKPPLAAGPLLAEAQLATAMDDISDGLLSELHIIADASECGVSVIGDRLPVVPQVKNVAALLQQDPFVWALDGGEEYELLVSLSPGKEKEAVELLARQGISLHAVGHLTEKSAGRRLVRSDSSDEQLPKPGWGHFS